MSKFKRQMTHSRALLDRIGDVPNSTILNTLYNVFPPLWDQRATRQRILKAFKPETPTGLSLYKLNQMRLYRRSSAHKVAICCMPKSGSTFILSSLMRTPKYDFQIGYIHVPYMNPTFVGADTRENELDELAVLRLEMFNKNVLAQAHIKASPYTSRVLNTHGYKQIVIQRNIFDCIVSMDDMICKGEMPSFAMARVPQNYRSLTREERLDFLCRAAGPWYVDFVVSWAKAPHSPLTLDYETDVKGFGPETAKKLHGFLELSDVPLDDFMKAFNISDDAKRQKAARMNVGRVGRGEMIPQEARDAIRRLAGFHANDVDFTGLL